MSAETSMPDQNTVLELRQRLKDIHNYVYANDQIKQHPKVLAELLKLLLIKFYTETKSNVVWPTDAERLRELFRSAILDLDLDDLFEKGESLELSPRVLSYAASQLSCIRLEGTDAKGAAFQTIVGPQVRGEKGQFFTPDPVRHLIVSVLDPQPTENMLDPACGSGGLLVQTIGHVEGRVRDQCEVASYCQGHLFGIEIDPTIARLARLNMVLHGDGRSNIFCLDALRSLDAICAQTNGLILADSMDVVATNPPFGMRAKVDDPTVLRNFPNVAGSKMRQVPDILFLERIVQLLKPGGRAGIVVPIGDIANSSLAYVREFLRSTCHIFATVSLPAPTFRPSENSVNAAVLFVRKWPSKKRPARYPTFRATSRRIGYDTHERPVYRKGENGTASGVLDEDISEIVSRWNDFRAKYGRKYLW